MCEPQVKLEGAGDVRSLGGNKYEITVSGNRYTEERTVSYDRWDAKAAETCKGPFSVQSRNYDRGPKTLLVYVVGIVECTSKAQNTESQVKRTPTTEAKATPTTPETSSQKMTVQQIQQRLSELGYKPGSADGKMGKNTVEALKKYQRDNKLAVTGQVDTDTIAKLLQKQ